MKKSILIGLLSTSFLFSQDISIDKIGLNVGKTYTSYDQISISSSVDLTNKPNKSFVSGEIYTILTSPFENKTIKPYISYTYSNNNELKHQYILVGVNKYYENTYAGVLSGYGELKWKYDPLNSSASKDYTSNSLIIGLQGGYEYKIDKNLFLNLNLKALYHKYETALIPSSGVKSVIENNFTSFAGIGIAYKF